MHWSRQQPRLRFDHLECKVNGSLKYTDYILEWQAQICILDELKDKFQISSSVKIWREFDLGRNAVKFLWFNHKSYGKVKFPIKYMTSIYGYIFNKNSCSLNTRESSLAAKAADCKSATKKHRRFESYLSHEVDKLNQKSIKHWR